MTETEEYWTFSDPVTIKQVLSSFNAFRTAERSEQIFGQSRTFFLAAELFGWKRGSELKELLGRFFGVEGIQHLRPHILLAVANVHPSVGFQKFIDVACERALYAVLGVPETLALPLVALLRIARDHPETEISDTAVQLLTEHVERLLEHCDLGSHGFVTWMLNQDGLTRRECVALLIPFFEMIALGQHASLARAAIKSEGKTAQERVIHATARVEGVVLTRVAMCAQTIAGRGIKAGDRVLLDVSASNAHTPTPNLCFGGGQHHCTGRLLAFEIAIAAVSRAQNVF